MSKNNPTILILTECYPPYLSGTSIFTQKLASYTSQYLNTIIISTHPKLKLTTQYLNPKLTVITLPGIPNPLSPEKGITLPQSSKFKLLLKNINPDLVHFQDASPIALQVMSILPGAQKIYTNHASAELITSYIPPIINKDHANRKIWEFFASFANKCNYVTAPTNTILKILNNYGLKKPSSTISCGIDFSEFYPSNQNKKNLKKHLGLPEDKFIFYYHGRIDPDKNLFILIKAFHRLIKQNSNAHLVISGANTPVKTILVQITKILNLSTHISWVAGKRDQRLLEYQAADCFIIPSIMETQSLVTLQALATGLPVIAANALALPELVHNNKNGYLFDPKSEKNLTLCMIKLLQDTPKKRLAFSSYSLKLIKSHEQSQTLRKYLKLYQKLLKNQ